jgi:hypothetical protein
MTKILKPLDNIKSLSDLIGNNLLEYAAEIINLHSKLEEIIIKYNSLYEKRLLVSQAAGTYFRNGFSITEEKLREYIIIGIEKDISDLLERRDQIKKILEFHFLSEKK